jgi:hypothetical protein
MYISKSNSPCPPRVRDNDPSTHYIDTVQLQTTVRGSHRMTKGAGTAQEMGKRSIITKITGKDPIQWTPKGGMSGIPCWWKSFRTHDNTYCNTLCLHFYIVRREELWPVLENFQIVSHKFYPVRALINFPARSPHEVNIVHYWEGPTLIHLIENHMRQKPQNCLLALSGPGFETRTNEPFHRYPPRVRSLYPRYLCAGPLPNLFSCPAFGETM